MKNKKRGTKTKARLKEEVTANSALNQFKTIKRHLNIFEVDCLRKLQNKSKGKS